MAGLFERLVNTARAYIYDFLEKPHDKSPTWETEFDPSPHGAASSASSASTFSAEEARARATSPLPYSTELAKCYQLLDLPFGVPMEQVTRQWRAYLRKYHPDLHARDATRQAEATELTRHLNDAHRKIKIAWEAYHRQHRR